MLADFTVTKVVAARLLLGFTGRLPDRASFGCALRFVPAPRLRRRRKISALFGVNCFGSSPIIFDCALWHAPRAQSAGDCQITAQ